jgi:hypothetical protein
MIMESVKEIEDAISRLSPNELSRLRAWFENYDAHIWDQEFDKDVRSGKLDELANQALADFSAGKYKEL